MIRYVFVGDSITDSGRDRRDPASLGNGYVSQLAAGLRAGPPVGTVVNLGVSGDRAVDLERRWQADVGAAAPDVLTVFVGVNDMWRRFDADDPTSAEAFGETYRRLLTHARSAGEVRLILMEPFFVPVRPEQREWLDDLGPKREIVEKMAAEFGADIVRLQERMESAVADASPAAIVPDGVHPTIDGHRLIADAWRAVFDHVTPEGRP